MTETYWLRTSGGDDLSRTERRIRRFAQPGEHKRAINRQTIDAAICILRSLIYFGWSRNDAIAGDEGEVVLVSTRFGRHYSITVDASALISITYEQGRAAIVEDEEDLELREALKILRGLMLEQCNMSAFSSRVGLTTSKKNLSISPSQNQKMARACRYSSWRVLQSA